ncbi:MAG: MFS transporter [Rhodoferax sp.]|nr:MFS transporter [Rhodoferax sp.]
MAHWLLLALVYLSFVSLGLPDAVLGVAWPAIRADMGQPLAAMGFITLTMTVCSASASFMSAVITKRIGTGVVVAGSCLMTALALIGFSYAPSFIWLVALGIPLGLGAGAVDASLNHFAAAHYSSRHMNWLHGFWGIGATAGPLIMGAALASSGGWTIGARSIGLVQVALAVVLWLTLSLWSKENATPPTDGAAHAKPLQFKPTNPLALWLAPLTFLFYVAAEMGTGLWAASILVGSRGVTQTMAGVWVALYFGAITAGRFGVGLIANKLGNRKLVQLGICIAAVGATLFAFPQLPAPLSMAGLMLMGLGCAPIFPSLMHETARRFPDDVARMVIGRQMGLAYAGGAIIPGAFGLLATWAGLAAVMPVVVVMLLALLVVTTLLNRMT